MSSLVSTLLPSRFRGSPPAPGSAASPPVPSALNRRLTPVLQLLSRLSCSHPIHTIVIVALLASSTYIGLLEDSFLFSPGRSGQGAADWSSLVEGSRRLRTGPDVGWRWQALDGDAAVPAGTDHLALLTFVFPESLTSESPQTAPGQHAVPLPGNLSVTPLPSTSNSFTTYAQDSALAFAIPYSQAAEFLAAAQEIPDESSASGGEEQEGEAAAPKKEKKMWIMKAARVHSTTKSSIVRWATNAWVEFLDLLKNAETLDIIIMVLGYCSMHLTFVSLFLSMRRMGSNFWLATSVIFSSIFAFLFGLIVTTRLGVPINMVLLSEGLPFLVVTVGFEKSIMLTRAVLTHAIEHRRPQEGVGAASDGARKKARKPLDPSTSVIQYAVQQAIKEKGFDIVKDYAIEILLLVAGVLSGVQGGLQQFCFLAAWILLFDCILLFTFYTAILSIKLEINRIKRHLEMRRALEDDGVSRRVAEKVATSNEWPGGRAPDSTTTGTLFGKQVKSSSVPKFKVLMVTGFVIVNVLNLCTIPFRTSDSLATLTSWAGAGLAGLGGVVSSPPVDPFKVAANGLDAILSSARDSGKPTVVTVLTPIKYELEYPSIHYGLHQHGPKGSPNGSPGGDLGGAADIDNLDGYGMGGRMVGSLLKSFEDPVLSKWTFVALAMSVALNGYLFNAARWSIKDPNEPDHPIDPEELEQAQKFNDTQSATLPLGEYQAPSRTSTIGNGPQPPVPPTPPAEELSGQPAAEKAMAPPQPKRREPAPESPAPEPRSMAELEKMLAEKRISEMTDEEVVALSLRGKIPGYALERSLKDCTRAVKVRRTIISRTKATAELTGLLDGSKLPYEPYNWEQVLGACCENVIGYMPIPVGVAGPLVIDGKSYFIPMATTEGVLVASTSRGCKAINSGGGAVTVLTADGMTRGPCVSFDTLERAGAAKIWLDSPEGQRVMERAFNSTSRFARLQSLKTTLAGTYLYIRFKTTTGDAMGMNMISKGVEHALNVMATQGGFDDMNIVSVSGNYCTDKKPAAINWIDGRGKSVVAEAIIPPNVVREVLKSDVDSLVELNNAKNLIGSAMAGSVGGFNAHAANIVAALFIATGQDPAQVVESANCITVMKK